MSEPLIVDIPHELGLERAKAKIASDIQRFSSIIPGSAITNAQWEADTLTFVIEAMGQRMASKLDVFDDRVRATIDLPPMLSMLGNTLRKQLSKAGQRLLK